MLREKDWTTYFFLLSRCAERFLLTFSEVRGWLVLLFGKYGVHSILPYAGRRWFIRGGRTKDFQVGGFNWQAPAVRNLQRPGNTGADFGNHFMSKGEKARSTTDTYWEALKKFTCPMGVVPLNENGMRQLRILGVPCYREKLIHQILGKDYLPSLQSTADGCSASTKENF